MSNYDEMPDDDEIENEDEPKARPVYEVCPECRGHGQTVHRALSVWTEEDRYADPDGFEDMMQGVYDVVCGTCRGERVIDVSEKAQEKRAYDREDAMTRAAEDGRWDDYHSLRGGGY